MEMRNVVTVLSTLLVLVAVATLGWGLSRLQSQPKAPLELSLSLEKESYLIGEPVLIIQRLINQSDKELKVEMTFDPKRSQMQIAVGDGPFQPYISSVAELLTTKLLIQVERIIITLQPGEKREDKGFMLFNAKTNDYAFPAAGRYRLKITFFYDPQDQSKKVESNVLEIKVVAPEREVDQKALKFITENQLKPFLNPSEVTFLPTQEKDANTIVSQFLELRKQFPESTYAPYAQQVIEELCRGRQQELPACVPPER